jgi:ethanolamine ammonia-lyase small subunit
MAKDKTPSRPNRPPQDDGLWQSMRGLTSARIGLKRAGASLATQELLDFQLAHARARDAVHTPLDEVQLATDLATLGLQTFTVASAAEDRQRYLMRPDLGRLLAPGGEATLAPCRGEHDVVFIITDGLSARATQTHAPPLLAELLPALNARGWRIAPLVIARNGRVGIGDAIATALSASCVVVLIGERPGLTATDSMGAYLTWRPHAQTTDADRNCISNIHAEGVGTTDAAFKLVHILTAMRALRISGVQLKDDSDQLLIGEN